MSTRFSIDAIFGAAEAIASAAAVDHPAPSSGGGEGCACSCSFDRPSGNAYNEAAFRYFLDIEQKRAETSNRRFTLLLVDLNQPSATSTTSDPYAAQQLIAALADCLRETDFVGWYRDGKVAGAVLTQWVDLTSIDSQDAAGSRVTRMLAERLPPAIAATVRVRLYQSPTGLPNVS
jgi:hypothetical protein